MDPTATTAPDPHYARLAYSTRTAPTTDPLEPGAMPDNQLTLISPDGEPAGPGLIHPLGVHADGDVGHAASWYQPRLRAEDDVALPVPGTRVETHTLAFGLYEVRLYAVTAPPGWGLRASGYSLADACPGPLATGRRWTAAHRPDGLVSAISALHSFQCTGLHTRSERDAFGSSPTVPYLTGHHPGGTRIYAAAVVLSGPPFDAQWAVPVEVFIDDEHAEVRLPDGVAHRWTLLALPDETGALLRYDTQDGQIATPGEPEEAHHL